MRILDIDCTCGSHSKMCMCIAQSVWFTIHVALLAFHNVSLIHWYIHFVRTFDGVSMFVRHYSSFWYCWSLNNVAGSCSKFAKMGRLDIAMSQVALYAMLIEFCMPRWFDYHPTFLTLHLLGASAEKLSRFKYISTVVLCTFHFFFLVVNTHTHVVTGTPDTDELNPVRHFNAKCIRKCDAEWLNLSWFRSRKIRFKCLPLKRWVSFPCYHAWHANGKVFFLFLFFHSYSLHSQFSTEKLVKFGKEQVDQINGFIPGLIVRIYGVKAIGWDWIGYAAAVWHHL